jgi:hypothetical protein
MQWFPASGCREAAALLASQQHQWRLPRVLKTPHSQRRGAQDMLVGERTLRLLQLLGSWQCCVCHTCTACSLSVHQQKNGFRLYPQSLQHKSDHMLLARVLHRSVNDGGSAPWLAYSTAECVVGLIKWPLDCDPRSSMGLIAHPGPIHGLVLSFDGRRLITLGKGAPKCMHDPSCRNTQHLVEHGSICISGTKADNTPNTAFLPHLL